MDDHDVAHVLVQPEVLAEEPGKWKKTVIFFFFCLCACVCGASPGQQSHQEQHQRQHGAVAAGGVRVVLQEHGEVEQRPQGPPGGVKRHAVLHLEHREMAPLVGERHD